jgi:hypothetical protein
MAMKPEDRYPSARDLKTDIEQWLADEPVRAYREPVTLRMWRWSRKNKGLVLAAVSAGFALLTLMMGTWIVVLEREIAAAERLAKAQIEMSYIGQNRAGVQPRADQFERSAFANLDKLAVQLGTDPSSPRSEVQILRKEILSQLITFWNEAIQLDTDPYGTRGWRSDFYQLQLALCQARLGDHQQAIEAVSGVESSEPLKNTSGVAEIDLEKMYDLARVYAVCAATARIDAAIAEQYGDRAMQYLQKVAASGFFHEPARARRLRNDRDLGLLGPRADFGNLLREAEPKPQ